MEQDAAREPAPESEGKTGPGLSWGAVDTTPGAHLYLTTISRTLRVAIAISIGVAAAALAPGPWSSRLSVLFIAFFIGALVTLIMPGKRTVYDGSAQEIATLRWHYRAFAKVYHLRSSHFGDQKLYARRKLTLHRRITYTDRDLAAVVLTTEGRHVNHEPDTTMTLAGGRQLSFPVLGPKRKSAVMAATEIPTNKRICLTRMSRQELGGRDRLIYEAVVPEGIFLTREIVWVSLLSAPWVYSYFRTEGGG